MRSLTSAAEGKGLFHLARRGGRIGAAYGMTTTKMDSAMDRFAAILHQYNCGATFPITTGALARNHWDLTRYQDRNIEFAVHGYWHVDHSRLSLAQQLDQFGRARELFAELGIPQPGFRCPYLRWNDATLTALLETGFAYDSSPSLAWPLPAGLESTTFCRVVSFYRSLPAAQYPALPTFERGLVRLPYSVPDDESLVDRLNLPPGQRMARLWLDILDATHKRGELFVLGLHPERIAPCEIALRETLNAALGLHPAVWIARLDEVAAWWRALSIATVDHEWYKPKLLRLHVTGGPPGLVVLARGLQIQVKSSPWADGYQLIRRPCVEIATTHLPFIGVSRQTDPRLAEFLRQQGYLVETTGNGLDYTFYLDRPVFTMEDERPLLTEIENGRFPLLRFGRWPDGAKSALAITGDIDALTIWDYGMRIVGN